MHIYFYTYLLYLFLFLIHIYSRTVYSSKNLVYSRGNDCNLICTNVTFAFRVKSDLNITTEYFQWSFMYPWTQEVNWTYIKRLEDFQGDYWTSYVRSVYVLFPGFFYTIRSEFHIYDPRALRFLFPYFDVLLLWTCRLYFSWFELGEWWNMSAINIGFYPWNFYC